jgi:hypothetical protein
MQISIVLFPFGPEDVEAVSAKEGKNILFGGKELDNILESENEWRHCLNPRRSSTDHRHTVPSLMIR